MAPGDVQPLFGGTDQDVVGRHIGGQADEGVVVIRQGRGRASSADSTARRNLPQKFSFPLAARPI